jgi:hypothetical protein
MPSEYLDYLRACETTAMPPDNSGGGVRFFARAVSAGISAGQRPTENPGLVPHRHSPALRSGDMPPRNSRPPCGQDIPPPTSLVFHRRSRRRDSVRPGRGPGRAWVTPARARGGWFQLESAGRPAP